MDLLTEHMNQFYSQAFEKAVLNGWSQCGYTKEWLLRNRKRISHLCLDSEGIYIFYLDGKAMFQISSFSEIQGNVCTVSFDLRFGNHIGRNEII